MSLTTLKVFIATVVVLATFIAVQYRRWRARLPPGPKGYPLIGNLLDMPQSFEWIHLAKWSEVWGSDLTSASVLGTNIINIHTFEKATQLLDEKSYIYSERPYNAMLGELMGWEDSMVMMPYSPELRESRKMFHKELGSVASIRKFFAYEEAITTKMLRKMLKSPEDWFGNVSHHVSSIMLKIAYGYTPEDKHDPIIHLNEKAMEPVSRATDPAGFLVNQIPFMKHIPAWVPGANFRRLAESWRQDYLRMVRVPFEMVVKQHKEGTAEESFTLKWLQQTMTEEETKILRHTSSIMYSAGVETTTAIIHLFFYIMATYPEIQKEAQDELNNVVGRERLPSMSDRDNLPYVRALIKEMLRFHPPFPYGAPHSSNIDDIHDGYLIPKGSIVMTNLWQMSRNPKEYTNPETFDPSRFIGAKPQQDPAGYVFGFGRRICPGRRLAEVSLYITVARLLATFNITPAKGANGEVEMPTYTVLPGIISNIKEFPCSITPRNANLRVEDLVDDNLKE